MENFQEDGGAPVQLPMMQQDNYPVKMGADSDLSCMVSANKPTNYNRSLYGHLVKGGASPRADCSDPDAERRQHVRLHT